MWCIGAMRKGLFRLKSKKKCCYNLEYRLLIFKRDLKNHNETGCLTEKNHFGVFSTFWCSIAWLSLRKMDSIHIHIENNFIFFFDSMLLCCCFCNFFFVVSFLSIINFRSNCGQKVYAYNKICCFSDWAAEYGVFIEKRYVKKKIRKKATTTKQRDLKWNYVVNKNERSQNIVWKHHSMNCVYSFWCV